MPYETPSSRRGAAPGNAYCGSNPADPPVRPMVFAAAAFPRTLRVTRQGPCSRSMFVRDKSHAKLRICLGDREIPHDFAPPGGGSRAGRAAERKRVPSPACVLPTFPATYVAHCFPPLKVSHDR